MAHSALSAHWIDMHIRTPGTLPEGLGAPGQPAFKLFITIYFRIAQAIQDGENALINALEVCSLPVGHQSTLSITPHVPTLILRCHT